MEYVLKYDLKYFSQYLDNIPVINGMEIHMSKLDLLKWKHYSTMDSFAFHLVIDKERTISMNIIKNGSSVVESVTLNKQDLDLQIPRKIQFSVNCPIISGKYLIQDPQLKLFQRRFQMTLRYESDFNDLTNILRQMGFVIKNAKLMSKNVGKDTNKNNTIAGNLLSPVVDFSFISNPRDNSFSNRLQAKTERNNDNEETNTLPFLETQNEDLSQRLIPSHPSKPFASNTTFTNTNFFPLPPSDFKRCNNVINTPKLSSNPTRQNNFSTVLEECSFNKTYIQDNLNVDTLRRSTDLLNSTLEFNENYNKNRNDNDTDGNNLSRDFGKQQEPSKKCSLIKDIQSDRNPKQTISQVVPSQQEECNLAFNNNNNNNNNTKKSKKKVHITRKLIKTKLKDKKFQKWVCIITIIVT